VLLFEVAWASRSSESFGGSWKCQEKMSRSSDIEKRVAYGLDDIDPSRRIEVSLCDLLFTYQTIGELIAFFHDDSKYPTLDEVRKFIGERDKTALRLLWEIYYRRLYEVWPQDIKERFDEGKFDRQSSSNGIG